MTLFQKLASCANNTRESELLQQLENQHIFIIQLCEADDDSILLDVARCERADVEGYTMLVSADERGNVEIEDVDDDVPEEVTNEVIAHLRAALFREEV